MTAILNAARYIAADLVLTVIALFMLACLLLIVSPIATALFVVVAALAYGVTRPAFGRVVFDIVTTCIEAERMIRPHWLHIGEFMACWAGTSAVMLLLVLAWFNPLTVVCVLASLIGVGIWFAFAYVITTHNEVIGRTVVEGLANVDWLAVGKVAAVVLPLVTLAVLVLTAPFVTLALLCVAVILTVGGLVTYHNRTALQTAVLAPIGRVVVRQCQRDTLGSIALECVRTLFADRIAQSALNSEIDLVNEELASRLSTTTSETTVAPVAVAAPIAADWIRSLTPTMARLDSESLEALSDLVEAEFSTRHDMANDLPCPVADRIALAGIGNARGRIEARLAMVA